MIFGVRKSCVSLFLHYAEGGAHTFLQCAGRWSAKNQSSAPTP